MPEENGTRIILWDDRIQLQRLSKYCTEPEIVLEAEIDSETREELDEKIGEAVHDVVEKDEFEIRDNAKTNAEGGSQSE